MTAFDTPDKIEKRRRQLEREKIDRLLALYSRKHREGDYAGAEKIAWILSNFYGIEGDHSFTSGSPQE